MMTSGLSLGHPGTDRLVNKLGPELWWYGVHVVSMEQVVSGSYRRHVPTTHARAVLLCFHCSRAPLAPGVRCRTTVLPFVAGDREVIQSGFECPAILPVSQVAGFPDPIVGLGSPVAWQFFISFLEFKNDGALPGTGDSSPDDKLQISVPESHPWGRWLSILCTKADRDPVQNWTEVASAVLSPSPAR